MLDVGCGDGSLLCRIATLLQGNNMPILVGVDLCRPLLLNGQKRLHSIGAGSSIGFIFADAMHLPFVEDIFDIAYAITIIHHVHGSSLVESRRMQNCISEEVIRTKKNNNNA